MNMPALAAMNLHPHLIPFMLPPGMEHMMGGAPGQNGSGQAHLPGREEAMTNKVFFIL